MTDSNTVLIGKKHTMSYVFATVTQFTNGEEEVVIKARGKAINKAVDVAEIVKNRFFPGSVINNISILTENLKSQSGDMVNVSSIEIRVGKADGKLAADAGHVVKGPKADAPKTDAPKAKAPKADAPKADAPKAEAPEADASKE